MPESPMTGQPREGEAQEPRSPEKVKGTLLIARMKFLRAQERFRTVDVLRMLPASDQKVLEGILLPSTWYPADLLTRLETAIAEVVARGDRTAAFTEMGRFAAQANLGPRGVQRPYLREGDPHHVLERLPRMYLSQHTTGRRTYERVGDQAATIRSFDCDDPADDCVFVVGWLQRAIELSGGVDVRVVEGRCRARGASHCEYHASWS